MKCLSKFCSRVQQLLSVNNVTGYLFKSSVGSILIKICQTSLGFLIAILLSRSLGAVGYGIYAFTMTIITLVAIPAQLGLPQLIVRETAKSQVNHQWKGINSLWAWCDLAVLIFTFLYCVVSSIVFFKFQNVFHENSLYLLLLSFFLVPVIAFNNMRGAALRGLGFPLLGQFPDGLIRPIAFVSLIFFITTSTINITPTLAILIHLSSLLVAFFSSSCFLRKVRPIQLLNAGKSRFYTKKWFFSALPLAMISAMYLINNQTDILMLGIFKTSEDVGVYKVVVSAGGLVVFGLQAINMVVAPYFAKLYAQNDINKLQNLVTRSSQLIFLLSLPFTILFVWKGAEILSFTFGDSFQSGGISLAILSFGQLVSAGFGSVGVLLNMTGYERITLRIVALSAIINVLLNLFLIPFFGITGAAVATSISIIIWNFLMWRVVKEKLNINTLGLGSVRKVGL